MVRIELTTSPLPRVCSTTELRQRLRRWRAYDGAALAVSSVAAALRGAHAIGMVETDKPKDQQREERLAAALRENLKRRKQQARALSGPAAKDGANGGE